MFAKCTYIDCVKSSNCKRVYEVDGVEVEFKYVCGEHNSYKWQVIKEEIKEEISCETKELEQIPSENQDTIQ